MDLVNARLVALLQARARLALSIARSKERSGLAAPDPARERAMLAVALRDAAPGFPRRDLARLLRAVFTASRLLVVRDRARRLKGVRPR